MRAAEHLAVRLVGRAAMAPCRDMVGVHLVVLVDAARVRAARRRADGAVGDAKHPRSLGLLGVDRLLCHLVEDADVQKPRLRPAAEHILEDVLLLRHLRVSHETVHLGGDVSTVVRPAMVLVVETAPVASARLLALIGEHGLDPVDDGVEAPAHLVDARVVSVRRHVLVDVLATAGDPCERDLEHLLAPRVALDVGSPAVHVRVCRVREPRARGVDERPVVGSVAQLLLGQRHTDDVDGTEPLLNLGGLALADINGQLGVVDALAQVVGQRVVIVRHAVDLHGKLVRQGHVAAEARDALLTVEHLVHTVGVLDEVDEAERIPLEQRLDDRDVTLAVAVDVVALVLGLDDEPAIEAEQTLALALVEDEAPGDVSHGPIGFKFRNH